MKKKDLQQLQTKKLKALLRHAYENVPYYHKHFKENNFHPADFINLEDLHRIPILKKATIQKKSDELATKNISNMKLEFWSTSGTTSVPVRFYRSKEDLSWGLGAEFRGYGWAGYETGDKLAWIWRFSSKTLRSLKFRLKCLLERTKILNVFAISEKSMATFASSMHRFKPDFIRGYGSSTNIFATFMLENNQFGLRPRAVFTTGEMLFPHYRKTIEEAFDCKVYEFYGSAEVSHAAAQCGYHEAFHVTEENVLLEVVKDNEQASPGEEGKVLLTNLNGFAMPFIRYDIGDLGKVLADTCSCGRKLSLFKPIGRVYEYFLHSDGSFTILRDLRTVFEDSPIKDFQVVQETLDGIVVRIVPRPGYTKANTDSILKNIAGVASPIAKIRVKMVDSIMPEKSGKVRHAVSKLSTKYT